MCAPKMYTFTLLDIVVSVPSRIFKSLKTTCVAEGVRDGKTIHILPTLI
jgi:hypothetical protein